MDKPELKPCPFCGGKPQLCTLSNSSSHFGVGFEFEIACTSCKIKLPNRFEILLHLEENGELKITKDDREIAVAAWNRRVTNERTD